MLSAFEKLLSPLKRPSRRLALPATLGDRPLVMDVHVAGASLIVTASIAGGARLTARRALLAVDLGDEFNASLSADGFSLSSNPSIGHYRYLNTGSGLHDTRIEIRIPSGVGRVRLQLRAWCPDDSVTVVQFTASADVAEGVVADQRQESPIIAAAVVPALQPQPQPQRRAAPARKRFIIKADDLRLNADITKFVKLAQMCERLSVPLTIGVIGRGLVDGRFRDRDYIARAVNRGGIELWNHSFSHVDLTSLTEDEMAAEIAETNSLCEKAFGVLPAGFGAPYNRSNEALVRVAARMGMKYSFEQLYDRSDIVTPEDNDLLDGRPGFDGFVERVARRWDNSTLVVQVHPGRWHVDSFAEFEKCVRHLVELGYEPTTPATVLEAGTVAAKARSIHAHRVERLGAYWTQQAEQHGATLSNFSTYFLQRFKNNSAGIRDLLGELDLDLQCRSIVDVGCGLGQWALPFLEFNRECVVHAYDVDKTLCRALGDAKAERLLPENFNVVCEDFTTSTVLRRASVDAVTCANALNYISIPGFLRKVSEICRPNGKVLLVNQTSSFNFRGYEDALKAGNIAMAKERAMAELQQQACRSGYRGLRPARTTHECDELAALFRLFRFKMHDRFVPEWERAGGSTSFQGYVFVADDTISVSRLGDETRLRVRTLLHQAGYGDLDDEFFGDHPEDLADPLLSRLQIRGATRCLKATDGEECEIDAELGALLVSKRYKEAARALAASQWTSSDQDRLLAWFVVSVLGNDLDGAAQAARAMKARALTRHSALAESLLSTLGGACS